MGSSVEEIVIEDLFPELKVGEDIPSRWLSDKSLEFELELRNKIGNYLTVTAVNHAYDQGGQFATVEDIEWAYRQLVPKKD